MKVEIVEGLEASKEELKQQLEAMAVFVEKTPDDLLFLTKNNRETAFRHLIHCLDFVNTYLAIKHIKECYIRLYNRKEEFSLVDTIGSSREKFVDELNRLLEISQEIPDNACKNSLITVLSPSPNQADPGKVTVRERKKSIVDVFETLIDHNTHHLAIIIEKIAGEEKGKECAALIAEHQYNPLSERKKELIG